MNKERAREIMNSKIYIEECFIGNKTKKDLLISSIFGKCEVITKEEVIEQFDNNECFNNCDNVSESKYKFFYDYETNEYFALLK